jgi:hypothetical protein
MEAHVLIAPSAALLGVLLGGALTSWNQGRLEREKRRHARGDALAKELLTASQQLTISVASSLHSMCWLCWLAATGPEKLTQVKIDQYDEEQHETLPKILGYLSTLAALDLQLYDMLRPHVDKVFALDATIGESGLAFSADSPGATAALAEHYRSMVDLERKLPRVFADTVRMRVESPLS